MFRGTLAFALIAFALIAATGTAALAVFAPVAATGGGKAQAVAVEAE